MGISVINEASGSLGKAIAILRCFVDRQEQWGVKELSVALDLPASTVHRFLKILTREGFLVFDSELQKYKVGMEFYRIAAVLGRRMRIRDLAQRFMREVMEATGESCWLSLYDPDTGTCVYVDEVEGPQPFRFHAPIGRREELWEGGTAGLAVLAGLPHADARRRAAIGRLEGEAAARLGEIRERGVAIRRQPANAPGFTIAAPIFNAREHPAGCLGLVMSDLRPSRVTPDAAAAALADGARRLSRSLGSQLLGGAGAGTWQLGTGVIADLVNSNVPDIGMGASWGAGNRNLDNLEQGVAGYCMAVASSLDAAYEGRYPFDTPHRRLRGMFSLFPLYLHIVARKELGIRRLSDIRGLRVSPAEHGFATAFVFDRLLEIAGEGGLSNTSNEIVHLDYAEANRQLSEGQIDVAVSLTGRPNPPYVELAEEQGIALVGIDDEILQLFLEEQPSYQRATIEAGTYPGIGYSLNTLAVPTVMCTVEDRPEDEVYEITKAVFENRHQLAMAAPAYAEFSREDALLGWHTPVHPGAKRFWEEIGPGSTKPVEAGRPAS